MQDLSDGQMKSIPEEFLKDIPKVSPNELAQLLAANQALKDATIKLREHQGPILVIGEIVGIKGGRFQVTKIEPGHLRLKSLPAEQNLHQGFAGQMDLETQKPPSE